MAPVSIRVEGLDGVRIAIEGIRGRVRDATPAFRLIDKHVTTVFQRQFATEGRFGGKPWAQLKRRTVKQRQKPGRGRGGILRDTNRLWASLTKGGNVPEGLLVIEPLRYVRGSQVPYAAEHQDPRRPGLAKREIVPDPMPENILNTWQEILARHYEGFLGALVGEVSR